MSASELFSPSTLSGLGLIDDRRFLTTLDRIAMGIWSVCVVRLDGRDRDLVVAPSRAEPPGFCRSMRE
ncbi:MAG: hypothetical protein M3143_00310, partial [Actinomycetota bacterium]|nr:hypothetical protein [Actinomycetota bacterium]